MSKKEERTYRSYIIHKAEKCDELDELNLLAGRIYSKTVSLVKKTHEKKDIWLKKLDLGKYIRCYDYPCTISSHYAVIEDYYGALSSYFERRKKDKTSRPPFRTSKYHSFGWGYGTIKVEGDCLRLRMGGKRDPILLKVAPKFQKVPRLIRLVYNKNTNCYEFHAMYEVKDNELQNPSGRTVSVDQGEIHPIVSFDGKTTTIYNGRYLRSVRQYRNKFLKRINKKLSRCKRHSRRWTKLKAAKSRVLEKIKNQIKDIEHKITSRFVSACHKLKVQTIVLGDLTHIRQSIHYGKRANQRLHQWSFGKIAALITYKAKNVGIEIKTISERYTSQTCPRCNNRKKPTGRDYTCPKCDYKGHRDAIGASNIWTKFQNALFNPVGYMTAAPIGIRFTAELKRLDGWSSLLGLKCRIFHDEKNSKGDKNVNR